MSLRNLFRFATVCTLVVPSLQAITSAQETRPPGTALQFINADRGMTLAQLVAVALDKSPAVLAARAQVDASRGERAQARLRPNPSLMSDLREEVGGTDRQTMVGLSVPLDLFRRPGRTELAERNIEVAEENLHDVERRLAGEVRSKVIQLSAAVRHLEVREQVAQTLTQFRDLVAARAASGASPPLERDMADIDARRAAAEVLRQRAVAEATLSELKALLGFKPSEVVLVRERLEDLARLSEPPRGRVADDAVGERADVKLAEAQIRAATAELGLIRLNVKPDVMLNTSYMRMRSGFPLLGLSGSGAPSPIEGVFHNISIGATVMLPLRDRGQGNIAAGTARITAAKQSADAVRLSAHAEVAAAGARVERLDQALAIYSGGLLDLASKNVEVMRGSYQLGRATLLDVLNETRRFLETETAYTDLLLEAMQARSDLATAMGVIR